VHYFTAVFILRFDYEQKLHEHETDKLFVQSYVGPERKQETRKLCYRKDDRAMRAI